MAIKGLNRNFKYIIPSVRVFTSYNSSDFTSSLFLYPTLTLASINLGGIELK
jgi:hypothetical protein